MPPPAAPTSTKEQVGAALQTAGQYAGGSTVWTPENAEELGLDPARGYVAKGTPAPPHPQQPGPQPGPPPSPPPPEPQSPQTPTPVEKPPPSMAPGLGITGGGPPPVRQEAPVPPVPPTPSQQSQQNGALPKGFIPDEGKEGQAGALPKGFIPDEGKEEEKPLPKGFVPEEEGQKKAAPPSISEKPAPVQAAAPPAAQVPTAPDQNVLYRSLLDQGHSPGAAQAIVAGQQPKTLNGQTPPKAGSAPTTPEKSTQPQPETMSPQETDLAAQFRAGTNNTPEAKAANDKDIRIASGQAAPSTEAKSAATSTVPTEPGTTTGGKTINGTSTIFALNYDGSLDKQDNGQGFFTDAKGHPIDTRKAVGAAIPWDILENTFGVFTKSDGKGGRMALDTPEAKAIIAKIQSAHIEVADDKGNIHKFPIVDIQGSIAGHPGKVLDLTLGATKELGYTDNHHVSYQIVGGDGKPYPVPDISALPAYAGKRKDDYVPTPEGPWISVGGAPSGGAAAPEQFRAPSERGGGGAQPDYSPSESGAAPVSLAGLGGLLAGTAVGALRGGQQAAQPSEEKGPSPSDVVSKVLAAGGPPPAPGAAPVDLSTMKQANVLGVRTLGAPQLGLPAPPPAPSAAPAAPDPIVIKGLMKRGFTREQALAYAAKATVSKPGAAALAGGASFRKPAQLPAPPAPPPAPSRQPPAAAKPQPAPAQPQAAPPTAAPPAKQVPTRPQPREATRIGPEGSTVGVPNPPGSEAITKWPRLADQAKQHAALLSPDDPRVKKQADGKIKGEHFVPGDPLHDQLLNGLPGGHGGRQRQLLAQAEQAIAEKRPMHISYLSAPKEAQKFPTRESRKIQYDAHSPEARLMGTTEGQLVGHSFIPVSVGITPSGKAAEPHQSVIHGLSTNVIANNFAHLNTKLAAMGQKTPYARFGPKFANDLEGYLHNLNAGHTGTGRGYALGTAEYPNEPDTSHVPYKLTRHEADFLNAVINNTGAFAKHEDAQALRELARVNGTLITPQGETNRLLHEIEQHDPGWSGRGSGQQGRVLEPSIRSFKTGLIHDVHPSEEHMPATIRPGQDYRDVTAAMQRTSERGRPDVPVAVSLHHTFADNKAINQIEREFSEERISEADARARLHALGEDPEQYRFVGGSGGLITPYEENPEAITPEEHSQLKDNLRKQWIGGKMPIEDYRRKAAEVPLPEIPSRPAAQQETPSEESVSSPKPKPPKPAAPPEPKPEETEPAEEPVTESPAPTKQRGFKAYKQPSAAQSAAPSAPAKAPEAAAPKEEPTESKAPTTLYYHTQPENRESIRQGGLQTKYDRTQDLNEPGVTGQIYLSNRPDHSFNGDIWKVNAKGIPLEKDWTTEPERPGETYHISYEDIPSHRLSLMTPKTPPGESKAPAPGEPLPLAKKPAFKNVKPEEFIAQRNKSTRAGFLSELKPEDIKSHKLFTNHEGTVGAAVSPEGDIQNVFNNGGPKGAAAHAIGHAIEQHGGKTLDAYDGFLPDYYRQFGFHETGRMKFNPAFAHNWDTAKQGTPDVVFMAHKGYPEGGHTAAVERTASKDKTKWIPNEQSSRYDDDWDAQKARSRNEAVAGGEKDYRTAGVEQGSKTQPTGGAFEPGAGKASRGTVGPPPAPGDILPPAPVKQSKAAAKAPPLPTPISPETQKVLGPQPTNKKQAALWQQAGERLDTQVLEGIPLEVNRSEKGKFKTDPKGKVLYKKTDYDIANSPLLQKQGKALGQVLNKNTGKMGMAKPPEDVEDDLGELDPENRLTPFLNPTDRQRVAHLNDISAVDAYADELHKMYKGIENLPEVMKGKNWYDEAVELLRKHFGTHADLMANLLGATSAGNKVKTNFNMAIDAYHQFLRGHYDDAIRLYNQAYNIQQSGKGALVKHVADNGIHTALGQEAPDTDERAMLQWIEHHNLTPRSSKGNLFSHNSLQVLKVLAHNWEKEARGPKTPNFAANLNGRSMQATIDMWAARTMRRLGFEGHTDQPWMIQPAGEKAVNNVDFGLSQLAYKKAAERIGIKPSALQAILWFAEQKEWQKRGWEREQDPDERDYRPMLKKYQRPGDISQKQVGKFHPSVPELKTRLAGSGGGVLKMQGGGVVPSLMTLGATDQQPPSPLLGQTTAPRATPVETTPAPRAEPPPAPGTPVTPASNWDQILQNAAPNYTGQPGGKTTVFATPKDLRDWEVHHSYKTGDNGVGSPALGSVDTAHSHGIAVPEDVMTKLYGGRASDPSTTANWRTARAQVTVNGKTYVVPISDLGPAGKPDNPKTPRGKGYVTDLTSDFAKGAGWMSDDSDGPVQIKLLPPGSGPDYLTDRKGWQAEQENIGKQLTPTPLGSSDIVNPLQYQNPPVSGQTPD